MSNDPVGNEMLKSLELFVAGIEAHENLTLIGEYRKPDGSGDTILVVEDNSVTIDEDGHQVTIELTEIFSAIKDEKSAQRFIAVVAREENPIKLNGITRIVGYYSRTHNWNKSKIGELRDRAKGRYGEGSYVSQNKEETLAVIDKL
jgi:hypothetical protein